MRVDRLTKGNASGLQSVSRFTRTGLSTAWLVAAGLTVSAIQSVSAYPIPVLDDDFNVSFPGLTANTEQAIPVIRVQPAPTCIEIQSIHLTGAELFSLDGLLPEFEQGCHEVASLVELVGTITNHYVSAGYVTSSAYLPEQDLSDGVLEIVVVEGRVEAIEFIENGVPRFMGSSAMPPMIGRVLNLRSVEQGLDQINGLRSRDASIGFRPGSRPGWSVVEVTVAAQPGWEFSSRVSNSGNGASGTWHNVTTATFEDSFGLFETLSFAHKRNLETDHGRQRSFEYLFDLTVPLGDWTLGWSSKATRYLSFIDAAGQSLTTSGDTLTNKLYVDRLVHRDQTSKTNVRASLQTEEIANYLNDVRIGVSSRTVSIGALELSHSDTLLGGLVQGRISVHRGLPLFGATDDGGPFAIFSKLEGNVSHTLPLFDGITFSSNLSGQWSPDRLYSSEQFSLTNVLGFAGSDYPGMGGESGLSVRGELAYTLPQVGSSLDSVLGRITAFAAFESGWSFSSPSHDDFLTNVVGAAIGLRANHGILSGSISWAVPLWAPVEFDRSGAFRIDAGITLAQF